MNTRKRLPPTYFNISALSMIILHFVIPVKKLVPAPYNFFGIILILLVLIMNIWASNFFKKKNTTIKPFQESDVLVTEGLFKFSRHPMYLGMVIGLIGLFILLGSTTPLLVIPIFVWLITNRFIFHEEKALEKKFGEDYVNYRKKVRRWI
jgi:protein-S-isoprenylcysteine O-methyltransferase Ste14